MYNKIRSSCLKRHLIDAFLYFNYRKIMAVLISIIAILLIIPTQNVEASTGSLSMEQSFVSPNSSESFTVNNSDTYNVTFDIISVDMTNPILVINVPKGINISYYPTASNATLAPTLISSGAVTNQQDENGNTVLTYRFNSDMTAIGFNITLMPTYKLDETTYTVSANYYDGETIISSQSKTVTITNNPTLKPNIMSMSNSKNSLIFNDEVSEYYISCRGYIYYYPSRANHYSYDYVEYTVPLPDESVPGLGSESSFTAFEEGVSYAIGSGTTAYSVIYYESYNYMNSAGAIVGNGKALVYILPSTHTFTSGNTSYTFEHNIYLKLTVTEPGNYSKNIRPQVKANVDGADIVLLDHVSYPQGYSVYSSNLLGCEIKEYNISDFFYAQNSYTYSYYGYYVLPVEGNTKYISQLYNKTDSLITDVKMEYTYPKTLYIDKIEFNLSSSITSIQPSTATVKYKTFTGGDTVYEAVLNEDVPQLQLVDNTDSIVWMEVVYDKLPHSTASRTLFYAHMTNEEALSTSTQVTSQIISAQSETLGVIPLQNILQHNFYLRSSYNINAWQSINRTTINKGDTFALNFQFASTSAEVLNPEYYAIMPSTYIFMGYTPNTAYQGIDYELSIRDLCDGTTLYGIKYNDNIKRNGNAIHTFTFKVGPAVPTSTVQTFKLPLASYFQHDGTYYPYRTSYMFIDIHDYDNDGDTTDQLAYSIDSERTTVTLNAVSAMTAQSYLKSNVTEGENTTMQYRYNSSGSYKYYMYNGLQSGNDASGIVLDIKVPKQNSTITYNSVNYTSKFNADLTGPVSLEGNIFTNSVVTYKIEGSEDYVSDVMGLWNQVTDIRIEVENGRSFPSSDSAIAEVPFLVSGFDNQTSSSDYAFFDIQMNYTLTSTGDTVHVSRTEPTRLQATYTYISGTIYKDFNANGTKDDNEISRNYYVYLYEGLSAEGTLISTNFSNYTTGNYSVGIISPGTYTLKVIKDNNEYYPGADSSLFNSQGEYTFTLGYPTIDQITGVNLGIIAPRTMSLNFSSVLLLEGTPRIIVPSLSPSLLDGEGPVVYSSSDESVVMVSSSGVLTYVSDGSATITVTVPQLSGIAAIEGESDVITKTISVICQKPGCNITAQPYASLSSTGTSITSHSIQLTRGLTSNQTLYYIFNRAGYCNFGHSDSRQVTWTIHDAGTTGATISSSISTYNYGYATLSVSSSGTVVLKASETWPHDEAIKPEDIYVTVNVYGQYDVTLPSAIGYSVSSFMSSSPVNHNGTFGFYVNLLAGYDQSDIVVKANGIVLTPEIGLYAISNITENKTVTVEGVAPNVYSVTLNTNGGTINSNNITSYTYSTSSSLPVADDISRAGYVFNGWTATNSSDDFEYITSISNTEIGDKQYYAKYTTIPVEAPTVFTQTGSTVEYGYSSATVSINAEASEGHAITGYQWYSCNQDKSEAVEIAEADSHEYSIPVGLDAGSYYYYCVITVTRADNSLIETFDSSVASFIVNKKPLTATAFANNKIYDGTQTAEGNISLSGIINSDTVSAGGTFTFTDSNVADNITVNVTNITLAGADSNNYSVNTTASANANISRKVLTASINDYSKIYNQPNPEFNIYVTGFVNGETASSASGYVSPIASTTATDTSVVGTYPIIITGGQADNYSFDISDTASLNILKKTLIESVTANDKPYDGNTITTGSISLDGIVGTDNVSASGTFNFADSGAGENKLVNVTDILLSGDDADNYEINSSATCIADISKIMLTATVNSYTKIYGQDNPVFDVNVTGFVNGETEQTATGYVTPVASTAADNTSVVGTYPISITGGQADNYSFDISDTASLNILKKMLAATVNNYTKVYGETNPVFEVAVTGFVNGDTADTASGYIAPTPSTIAEDFTEIGIYVISLSGGQADNYTFDLSDTGLININERQIDFTVNAYDKEYDSLIGTSGIIILSGIVNNDMVYANATFTFDTIFPGSQKTVSVTNIRLYGDDAHNYVLSSNTAATIANITYDNIDEDESDTESGIDVYVNGQSQTAAKASSEQINGKKVTTITIEDKKIDDKLEKEGNNSVVTIQYNDSSDTLTSNLNGQTVKNMEQKEAILEIKSLNITYSIPASDIDIDDVASKLDDVTSLSDIEVSITISNPAEDTVNLIQNTADENNYSLVVQPVQFDITCTSESGQIQVTKFNSYVERLIMIPEGVDPNKITTGIVMNEDGTFTHVPTKIIIIDGIYYAKINSLTNSVYSIIWNVADLTDVKGHWAEDIINDMNARLVVEAKTDDKFAPNTDITRAEFTDILIRGLGLLRAGTGKLVFDDVTEASKYFDSISIAYDYGIIKGVGGDSFNQDKLITREHAMLMIYRAMKITNMDAILTATDFVRFNASFDDETLYSPETVNSAVACFKYGIMEGKAYRVSDPLDNLSRAEAAVFIYRLLKISGLI